MPLCPHCCAPLTSPLCPSDLTAVPLCPLTPQAACCPYFSLLERWIHRGEVADPYGEFMVEEHEDIVKDRLHKEYNDTYWERRYTICQVRE